MIYRETKVKITADLLSHNISRQWNDVFKYWKEKEAINLKANEQQHCSPHQIKLNEDIFSGKKMKKLF